MDNALQGQEAEIRMTVSVTRKATGEVETFEMVGKVESDDQPPPQDQQKESK
jgi:hypothetical protein